MCVSVWGVASVNELCVKVTGCEVKLVCAGCV